MKTDLVWLNTHNGADKVELEYMNKCLEFDGQLTGVIMGSAYGGSAEAMGKVWKGRGIVYAYDTFEGHPKHLAINQGDREATCMDHWYKQEIYGTDKLKYEYQRGVLDSAGLDNVVLVKGIINKNSCDDLKEIHYAFLDLDLIESMRTAFYCVKDKIVHNGYLLLHDVITDSNLPMLKKWYDEEIKTDKKWKVLYENGGTHLAVLQRI